MTTQSPPDGDRPDDGRADEDRIVSRRVDNPTAATPDDERAYRAADPLPDGTDEVDEGSEPTRSE